MKTDQPLEAVLFDLDDTLIHWAPDEDDRPVVPYVPYLERLRAEVRARYPGVELFQDELVDALEQTIQALIQEAIEEMRCPAFEDVLRRTFERLGVALTGAEARELIEACPWALHPRASLEPNAEVVLSELRRRRLKLGVFSNSLLPGAMRSRELEALGLREHFDVVLTSSDARRFKPHPEVFTFACERLGCRPSATVMVGDSLRDDARAAGAAGLRGIWYAPSGQDSKGVVPTEADVTIRDLADLLDLLA